jgi:hypothetical protein
MRNYGYICTVYEHAQVFSLILDVTYCYMSIQLTAGSKFGRYHCSSRAGRLLPAKAALKLPRVGTLASYADLMLNRQSWDRTLVGLAAAIVLESLREECA